MDGETTVHDIDHRSYDLSGLEPIISEYEDLSKYFDYMIITSFHNSSTKKSDMLNTTTRSENYSRWV